jgi:hypothetical protein
MIRGRHGAALAQRLHDILIGMHFATIREQNHEDTPQCHVPGDWLCPHRRSLIFVI